MNADQHLHLKTPLIASPGLSARAGRPLWLKLELLQPSGSFKMRGVGRLAQRLVERGAKALISSSGGNAGLAAAAAGQALGVPVTVCVPETTSLSVRERLKAFGALVVVMGTVWDEAHAHALFLAEETGGALIHPFDHEDLWAGHATLVPEILADGLRPDLVILSVGGGGLLAGIHRGLEAAELGGTHILAVETAGAASLAAAVAARDLVTLPAITSRAKSLGARCVAREALRCALTANVHLHTCTDAEALRGAKALLQHHRLLVELACGAAVAPLLTGATLPGTGPILVIVCGGVAFDLDEHLQEIALLSL